jgi:DNA polymerase-3 subunit alpha
MDSEEIEELLSPCFPYGFVDKILDNTLEMQDKIEQYSLFHKQDIPRVEVKKYPKNIPWSIDSESCPNLTRLAHSDDDQDRYWVNQCLESLEEKNLITDNRYITELEEEARVKTVISEKLETNMFRYPNTLQHYIDMIWDCGSMVGAGRGSSCAALNHYLMGITQLDPIEWDLPFFRYLNDERVELGSLILILPSCK